MLEAGSRPDVAKVIILVTDGKATDDPLEIAKLIHDWKVLVYTIGRGGGSTRTNLGGDFYPIRGFLPYGGKITPKIPI